MQQKCMGQFHASVVCDRTQQHLLELDKLFLDFPVSRAVKQHLAFMSIVHAVDNISDPAWLVLSLAGKKQGCRDELHEIVWLNPADLVAAMTESGRNAKDTVW